MLTDIGTSSTGHVMRSTTFLTISFLFMHEVFRLTSWVVTKTAGYLTLVH